MVDFPIFVLDACAVRAYRAYMNNTAFGELDFEPYRCEVCGEADIIEAFDPVYVATVNWHRVEKLVHPECRELFVKDNLPAVLASTRGARL